jgi:DNA (cytosine-5)-methyltransferase 1
MCENKGLNDLPIGVIDPQGRTNKTVSLNSVCPTLRSQSHGNEPNVVLPVLTPEREEKRQNGRRFKDNNEDMFTLTAQDRHGVAIEVKEATKKGYAVAHEGDSINLSMPDSKTRRGRIGGAVAQTLDTSCNQGVIETIPGTIPSEHPGQYVEIYDGVIVYAVWYEKYQCYVAIRKLTPRECFRLQGWDDEYFERAEFVNSDSQLYKQAGNGVTVSVVQAIAEALNETV